MDALDLLANRRSVPARHLGEPGPSQNQLEHMLRLALRVPDHGHLTPWRFVCIRGAARIRLGERLERRQRERDPNASATLLEKDRQRFSHAPVVVAVVGMIDPNNRIPGQEQLLSGGCVCFSLLLAAQAMGFGAQWLTSWAAYDPVVAVELGLREKERILGFIHIGSSNAPVPERERLAVSERLTEWLG